MVQVVQMIVDDVQTKALVIPKLEHVQTDACQDIYRKTVLNVYKLMLFRSIQSIC